MKVVVHEEKVEALDADALLLPVDGAVPRLGSAAARGLRAALAPEERVEELEGLGEDLKRLAPLAHGDAVVIGGVARWTHLVVAACLAHNVNDRVFSIDDHAQLLRRGVARALEVAASAGVGSLALTVIGVATRMPPSTSIDACVAAMVTARAVPLIVRWSIPDAAIRELARTATTRALAE